MPFNHKYLALLALPILLLSACTKSEIPTFDSEYDAIRFPKKDTFNEEAPGYDYESQLFKASYSFVSNPEDPSHDFEIPLELIGMVADRDRTVGYTIDTEQSDAPSDSYKVLSAIMPAGQRQGKIVIRIFNTPQLKEKTHRLFIRLTSSEDLHSGPSNLIQGTLSWGIRIPAPEFPDLLKTYNSIIQSDAPFNSSTNDYFSPNALEAIVAAMKWYDLGDYNGARYGMYKYLPAWQYIRTEHRWEAYAQTVADYIEEYNTKHPNAPLIHDAGKDKGKRIVARNYLK